MIDLTKFHRLAALLKRRKPTTQTLFPPMREIPAEWRNNSEAKTHLQEIENEKNDLPF
jgi:hypothetical protein